jgi:hypothetical protein
MSKPVLMVPQNCYRRPLATRTAVILLIVAALVMVACGSPTEPITPTERQAAIPNRIARDVSPSDSLSVVITAPDSVLIPLGPVLPWW